MYRRFNPNDVDGAGRRVLVAEDSAPMRSIVCAALKKRGFESIPVENGAQALKAIKETPLDCCILDLNLPQIGGLDILEALRRDEKYSQMPVIICTAQKDKNSILTAQRLGVSGYVAKPFQMEDLIRKVGQAATFSTPAKPAQ